MDKREQLLGMAARQVYSAVAGEVSLVPDMSKDPEYIKFVGIGDLNQYHEEIWVRPVDSVRCSFVSKKVFELVGGRLALIVGDQEL